MEITSLSSYESRWEITDMGGRILKQGEQTINMGSQKIKIETTGLAKGIYIASLQFGDKKVFRKFIVD